MPADMGMPLTEKILTRHPEGKKGVNISKQKYDFIRNYILATLSEYKEITFEQLSDMALNDLTGRFDGKVLWYLVTIKLDLEARQIIERVPKTSPQRLRLKMI